VGESLGLLECINFGFFLEMVENGRIEKESKGQEWLYVSIVIFVL